MKSQPIRVVIIGGGISGLSTAFYTMRAAEREGRALTCTVLESSSRWGGKILTNRAKGFIVEGGPDSFLTSKPWGLKLCEELGLSGELVNTTEANNQTYIFSRGRLREFPQGLVAFVPTRLGPLFKNGLLSWPGILRMAGDWFLSPRRESGGDESLAGFFRRRLGREAFDRLIEPLVAGIYAGDAEEMSLSATFPRFAEIEREHGSLIKGMLTQRSASPRSPSASNGIPRRTLFTSLRNGLGDLVQVLVDHLEKQGVRLHLNQQVESVEMVSGEGERPPVYRIGSPHGSMMQAEAVVVSTPAFHAADLLQSCNEEVSGLLRQIPYASTGTVSLAFPRSAVQSAFQGFGFVIPRVEQRSLIAATWSSSKWPNRVPSDECLIRCYVGGRGREQVFALSDEELIRHVLKELRQVVGVTAEPIYGEVFRWMQGMPQYTLGHVDRVRQVTAALTRNPGLFVTGAAYRGIGIPDCIREAEQTASNLLSWVRSSDGS